MKYYWTRFLTSYPKTLTYMLQSSDYKIEDYHKWLARSGDFRKIAKRRELNYTNKAKLILLALRLVAVVFYLFSILVVSYSIYTSNALAAVLGGALLVICPLIIAYIVALPLWVGEILIQKPKQKKLIAEASQILANHPGLKIAIAGSYGKTTAKEILKTVLSAGRKVAATPGNMNTPIGISRFAKTLTGKEEILIIELGEGKIGDVRELCELAHPDIGVITGINEAHLESFGTIENTVSTIFEIQDYLVDKPIYKNKESELVAGRIQEGDQLAYSRDGVNGWKIHKVDIGINGVTFEVKKGSENIIAYTGLLGRHNLGILAAAISIADSLGFSPAQIASGLEETEPFEHRMHPKLMDGAWIIDDTYNGNSEGVKAGLALLEEIDAKRRIYITPGLVEQGEKNQEVHENIGRQIAEVADVVVLMKNSVTDYIKKGLDDGGFAGQLMIVDDPLDFYKNLDKFVASGDVVLMQNDWTDNYA